MDEWDSQVDSAIGVAPPPPPVTIQTGEPSVSLAAEPHADWGDVVDSVIDPGQQHRHLEEARKATQPEPTLINVAKRSIPFISPLLSSQVLDKGYREAKTRFDQGVASQGDAQVIAQYERTKEDDSKKGPVGQIVDSLLGLPAIVGEAAMTGGAGPASMAARTPLMPSMFLPSASERAMTQGGEVYSPKNLAPAVAYGMMQSLVMGAASGAASGITNPAFRFAAKVGIGVGEMEGVKVAAGAVDPFLPDAYKINTHFGAVGDLLTGKAGKGLQELLVDAATMAAIVAMHGNKGDAKKHFELTVEAVNRAAAEGAIPDPPVGGPDEPGPRQQYRYTWYDEQGNPSAPGGGPRPGYDPGNAGPRADGSWGPRPGPGPTDQPGPGPGGRRRPTVTESVHAQAATILGIDPNASPDDIRRAYQRAAMQNHPDRGGSHEAFLRVQWAYDTLNGKGRGKQPPPAPPPESEAAPQNGPQAQQRPQDAPGRPRPPEGQPAAEPPPDARAAQPERPPPENAASPAEVQKPATVDEINASRDEINASSKSEPVPEKRPAAERLGDLLAHADAGGDVSFDDVLEAADVPAEDAAAFKAIHPRVGGQSLRQAAAEQGVSAPTIAKRAKRAMEKMGVDPNYIKNLLKQQKAEFGAEKVAAGKMTDVGDFQGDPEDARRAVNTLHDEIDAAQNRIEQINTLFEKGLADGSLSFELAAKLTREAEDLGRFVASGGSKGKGASPRIRGKAAQRPAGESAPVRHPADGGPGGGAPANPPAEPVAGPPARQDAGGQAAPAGQPQAAGDVVKQPRMSPWQREWAKKAADAGLSMDALAKGAAQFHAQSHAKVDEHNAIIRRALEEVNNHHRRNQENAGKSGLDVKRFTWKSVQARAHQDANAFPGLDDVAQQLGVDENKLFEMMQAGLRDPITKTEALQAALDDFNDHKEAMSHAKEAQRAGWPKGATQEALQRGQADGEAEGPDREGAPDLGDDWEPPGAKHAGGLDFDFGANDEFAGPSEPPAQSVGDSVARAFVRAAVDALRDDSATFRWAGNGAAVKEHLAALYSKARYIGDGVRRLAGQMFPTTHRLNRATGEALSEMAAAKGFAKLAAEHYAELVLGHGASEAADIMAGAVMTERRLRYMKREFLRQGNTVAAGKVTSMIGGQGSPLLTVAGYQGKIQSPQFQAILKRWIEHFVPIMEANYRASQGLDDTDPIHSPTQIPGQPMNLKAMKAGEDLTKSVGFAAGARHDLRAPKAKRFGFAKAATGSAEAYDLSLRKIIENTLARGVPVAKQATFYRTAVENGVGKWARPGAGAEFDGKPGVEFKDVNPPRGTQAALAGQTSFYAHPDAAPEIRRAMGADDPGGWTDTMNKLLSLPTAATLASSVELATHGLNLATAVFNPGVRPMDMARNLTRRLTDYPSARAQLVKLAEMGAYKGRSHDTGTVVDQINRGIGMAGLKLPEGAKYADPTYWGGRVLSAIDDTMRMTLDNAYDRLVAKGLKPDHDQGRRDFINQALGQYNAKAQNGFIALARATGLGPFATAGSQMTTNAVRRLLGGLQSGTSATATARLTANGLGRLFGMLGASVVSNVLAWGRWDGDDDVPFGAIKVGSSEDGRSRYIDTPASIVARRGLRATGLLAMIEGERRGQAVGKSFDRGVTDVTHSVAHPFLGPGLQAEEIARTGKDLTGRRVAEKAGEEGWQTVNNVGAAAMHANPVVASFLGHDSHEKDWFEKWNSLLGPFGIKTAPARR